MDLESLETQTLLKKRTPMRQSLALKLEGLRRYRLERNNEAFARDE